MRIRTIKPEFFKHDRLAELEPMARLLFIGLWCLADSAGRLEDRPKRIKVEVLPYDEADIDALLGALADAGFIRRYSADGSQVIEIPSFREHQRITGREAETPSRLPVETTGKQPGNNEEAHGEHPVARERKGKEGKGNGKEGTRAVFPRRDISFSNAVMPDLETWLMRANPGDEWEVDWWTKTFQREAGAGWTMKGGRKIVDWCLRQDSFLGYFRSAKAEHDAKNAPPDDAAFEEERRRDEARRKSVEQREIAELQAAMQEEAP